MLHGEISAERQNPRSLFEDFLIYLLTSFQGNFIKAFMLSTESKIFLLRQGIAQKQIALALGISETAVSLLLSGDLWIDARLNQIATYLGITRRQLDKLIHPKLKKKAA